MNNQNRKVRGEKISFTKASQKNKILRHKPNQGDETLIMLKTTKHR